MTETAAAQAEFVHALTTQLEGRDRGKFCRAVAEESGESFTTQALDQWVSGSTRDPSRAKVFAAERVLDLPPGSLSRLLGYLPVDAAPALSPEDAIRQDSSLPRAVRDALVAAVAASRRG